jgi:hypothetical protein
VCLLFTEQRIFLLLLWNENVKHSVHKNQSLVSIVKHINPMFNHTHFLSQMHHHYQAPIWSPVARRSFKTFVFTSDFRLACYNSHLLYFMLLILKKNVTNKNYATLDYVNFCSVIS